MICGVGIIDVSYKKRITSSYKNKDGKLCQKLIWTCPYYLTWCNMLRRAYSEKEKLKNPSYKYASVCDEWLKLSSFKAWMETQDWQDKQLDKDLLVRGNKVYSPETCCFVSSVINSFVTECNKSRGEWPIGVYWFKRQSKFKACCRNPFTNTREHLGYFDDPNTAHQAWLTRKLELSRLLAAEQDDPRVAKALVERYENYEEIVS